MQLTVEINCDNAAFEGEEIGPELSRILRGLADGIESSAVNPIHGLDVRVRDVNGNVVGTARME